MPVAKLKSSLRYLIEKISFIGSTGLCTAECVHGKLSVWGTGFFMCGTTKTVLFLHTPKSQQNDLRRIREH